MNLNRCVSVWDDDVIIYVSISIRDLMNLNLLLSSCLSLMIEFQSLLGI